VSETLGELTIAIVARCLFSSDVAEHVAEIRRELDLAQHLGNVLLRIPLPLYGAVPYLPVFRRITKAAARLRSIVTSLIERRRACKERPADLLEALMTAAEDQSQGGMTENQGGRGPHAPAGGTRNDAVGPELDLPPASPSPGGLGATAARSGHDGRMPGGRSWGAEPTRLGTRRRPLASSCP
jgi:hypothetical protein